MDLSRMKRIAASICASHQGWGEPAYIASGNSGSVFRLDHPTYGPVALKVYDPALFEGENSLIEANRVRLQEQLRGHGNPWLIDVLEADEQLEHSTWYMLMELCDWDSLDVHVARIPDENVQPLLSQLVNAVKFLESKALVHRDIKPANIAVSPELDRLKLLDLGVLRRISPDEGNGTDFDEKKRFIATAQYSPPEYLTREELPGASGFMALNIYQVGAVAHDLIVKKGIFSEEAATRNRYILYKAVTSKRPFVSNPNLPARLISLCKTALDKDPTRRASGVRLADFLESIDTPDMIRRRLAAQRPSESTVPRCPSILEWHQRVCDWVRIAAVREKSTLGPVRLPQQDCPGGAAWLLTFSSLGRAVRVELTPAKDRSHLVVDFGIDKPSPVRISVLEIYANGPSIPEEELVDQLSEHILYMVDLAGMPNDLGDAV